MDTDNIWYRQDCNEHANRPATDILGFLGGTLTAWIGRSLVKAAFGVHRVIVSHIGQCCLSRGDNETPKNYLNVFQCC